MLIIFKKASFLVGLTLFVIDAHSQIVTSTRDGVWSDPTTWSGGVIPTSMNAAQVVIDHAVEFPPSFSVSVFHLVIHNSLTLHAGDTLEILEDTFPGEPDMQVSGTLVMEDSAFLMGTSPLNAVFESGANYLHHQGPLGFIPYAAWDASSTFTIAGFTTSGYINIAHSDSWKQAFGNVVYDCPQQTIFVVDLNGYLRNIAGDFTIKNTNNQTLRLSTTQNPLIDIGGNLSVEGPSEVWFGTNGTAATVAVQGNMIYQSTSTGPSYLTTRGITSLNIGGDLVVDSPGPIRMTSSSADSLGTRQATITLGGDLRILSGTLIAPPVGNGSGKIIFDGPGIQFVTASASSFQGNMDYVIESNSVVDLGTSTLSNDAGMLQVKGGIRVGSVHPLGAIQLGANGNILVKGSRIYEDGSSITYNGLTPQWIGDGHPPSGGVNVTCDNPTEVSLLQSTAVGGLRLLKGTLRAAPYSLDIYGDLTIEVGAVFQAAAIRLLGNQNQLITSAGIQVDDMIISKSSGNSVTLAGALAVKGLVSIESVGTTLFSNGYLSMLSTGDQDSGTASIGPVPYGSRVVGAVTVARHMDGEGRIYRYLSSPVQNATVASMMDDFPVTGLFSDPSTGSDLHSATPSLFFYEESRGGLQEGWQAYPTAGQASANLLEPGRGYAAFIRESNDATVWDVTGDLNQGEIALPVTYTPGPAAHGWNLVGNPYAATIDWDITGSEGWTKQHLSDVIAIRDNGAGGTFHYWDGDVNYDEIPGGQIASCQSFWVRAMDVDPVLVIREGVKVPAGAEFFRRIPPHIPSFALTLVNGTTEDKTYVKVRPDASTGTDHWDALKLDNDYLNISILSADGVRMAIEATDRLPQDKEVFHLATTGLKPGQYAFSLTTKYDFTHYTYSLVDHFLDNETLLDESGPVPFEVTDLEGSAAWNRFSLRLDGTPGNTLNPLIAKKFVVSGISPFGSNGDIKAVEVKSRDSFFQLNKALSAERSKGGESVEYAASARIHLFPNPAYDYLTIESDGAGIEQWEIFDTLGRRLNPLMHGEGDKEINIQKLTSGVYYVRVLTTRASAVIRFVKR